MGELDLGLALPGLGVLGEDVEDECGAVHHFGVDDVLEASPLGGGELLVDDDGVRLVGAHDVGEFLGLPGPQVGRGVGQGAPLDDAVHDPGSGGLGQCGEFAQRVLRLLFALRGAQAHQDDALEAHLAVLDFGDVRPVRGGGVDAAGGGARLALHGARVAGAVLPGCGRQRLGLAREDARHDLVDAGVAGLVIARLGGGHVASSGRGGASSVARRPRVRVRAGAGG